MCPSCLLFFASAVEEDEEEGGGEGYEAAYDASYDCSGVTTTTSTSITKLASTTNPPRMRTKKKKKTHLLPPFAPVPVGYVPPAGVPGVELGLLASKHDASPFDGFAITRLILPPVWIPLLSPATTNSCVPVRRLHFQVNPRPNMFSVVMGPWGIVKASPPGMTPWYTGSLCGSS